MGQAGAPGWNPRVRGDALLHHRQDLIPPALEDPNECQLGSVVQSRADRITVVAELSPRSASRSPSARSPRPSSAPAPLAQASHSRVGCPSSSASRFLRLRASVARSHSPRVSLASRWASAAPTPKLDPRLMGRTKKLVGELDAELDCVG